MEPHVERVGIEYCNNGECQGHKGPDGNHAHINIYYEGIDDPVRSPAFGSRKAGTALALLPMAATAEMQRVSSLIVDTVSTANLPETYGDDDRFVESFKIAEAAKASGDTILLIIGNPGHEQIERMIDHNEYTIVLMGCLSCGASILLYHGDRLIGYAERARTMDHAKRFLDQATERFKLPADNATALREKLPKLFEA